MNYEDAITRPSVCVPVLGTYEYMEYGGSDFAKYVKQWLGNKCNITTDKLGYNYVYLYAVNKVSKGEIIVKSPDGHVFSCSKEEFKNNFKTEGNVNTSL